MRGTAFLSGCSPCVSTVQSRNGIKCSRVDLHRRCISFPVVISLAGPSNVLDYDDFRADSHPAVEIHHVLVQQAYATGRNVRANRVWLIGSVNAIQ